MNQGIFFGQIVIGPAGSGKVDNSFYINLFYSPHTAKQCNKWRKPYGVIS